MNPKIYEDPYKWDPARYDPGRAEDKKIPHGYIGWGSGRHPCCKSPRFGRRNRSKLMRVSGHEGKASRSLHQSPAP